MKKPGKQKPVSKRDKRAARKHKQMRRVREASTVGGLIAFDKMIDRALDNKPLNQESAKELMTTYWISFSSLTTAAEPTETDLEQVIVPLNCGVILCEMGIGDKEDEQTFNTALEGVFRAKLRGEHTGKWRLDGPAIEAVRKAFDLADQQITIATRGELRKAFRTMEERMEQGIVYTGTYTPNQPLKAA